MRKNVIRDFWIEIQTAYNDAYYQVDCKHVALNLALLSYCLSECPNIDLDSWNALWWKFSNEMDK